MKMTKKEVILNSTSTAPTRTTGGLLRQAIALVGSIAVWVGLSATWLILKDWQPFSTVTVNVGVVLTTVAVILRSIHYPGYFLNREQKSFLKAVGGAFLRGARDIILILIFGVFLLWRPRNEW